MVPRNDCVYIINLHRHTSPTTHSNGGRVNEALNYTNAMGLRTYGSYPYTAAQGTCRGPDPAFAYSAGPTFVTPCDERQLMKALYYFGPVAVNVVANCPVRLWFLWFLWFVCCSSGRCTNPWVEQHTSRGSYLPIYIHPNT